MKQYNNPAEIRNDWEAGELTAIEAHVLLKQFEDTQLAPAIEAVRPFVRESAERIYEGAKGKMEVFGYEIKLAETGTKWDYSGCNSTTLAFLQKQAAKAKEELDAYQKYLQSLPGPTRDIDPETGEPTEDEDGMPCFMYKAVKTSTSFVTVSKPKEAAKKPAPMRNEDAYHEMPDDRELTNYK